MQKLHSSSMLNYVQTCRFPPKQVFQTQKTITKLLWIESFRIVLRRAFNIIGIEANVNSILRGIYVPTGQNKVVMEFIPKDIIYGTILTFTSTLLILIFILSSTFINRKINAD